MERWSANKRSGNRRCRAFTEYVLLERGLSVRGRTKYNVRDRFCSARNRGRPVISVQSYICVVLNHRSAHAHAPVRTQDQASRDRRHQIRIGMAQHEQKRTDAEVMTEALRAKAREEFFLK